MFRRKEKKKEPYLSYEEKMRIARDVVDATLLSQQVRAPTVSCIRTAQKFEFLIKTLFERMGFRNVRTVGGPGDEGVDVEAFTDEGRKVVIQCKHHRKDVGPRVVREFAHVIERDPLISQGYLITSSRFSSEAKIYAQKNKTCRTKMSLIDREGLVRLLKEHGLSFDYVLSSGKKFQLTSIHNTSTINSKLDKVLELEEKAIGLEREGKLEEAKQLYWQIVSMGFEGSFPYERLRIIYAKQGDLNGAIKACQAYVDLNASYRGYDVKKERMKEWIRKYRAKLNANS